MLWGKLKHVLDSARHTCSLGRICLRPSGSSFAPPCCFTKWTEKFPLVHRSQQSPLCRTGGGELRMRWSVGKKIHGSKTNLRLQLAFHRVVCGTHTVSSRKTPSHWSLNLFRNLWWLLHPVFSTENQEGPRETKGYCGHFVFFHSESLLHKEFQTQPGSVWSALRALRLMAPKPFGNRHKLDGLVFV